MDEGIVTRSKSKELRKGMNENGVQPTTKNDDEAVTGTAVEPRAISKANSTTTSHAVSRSKGGKSHSKQSIISKNSSKKSEALKRVDQIIAQGLREENELLAQLASITQKMSQAKQTTKKMISEVISNTSKKGDNASTSTADSIVRDIQDLPQPRLSNETYVENWLGWERGNKSKKKGKDDKENDEKSERSMKRDITTMKQNTSVPGCSSFNFDMRTFLARQTIDKDLPLFSGNVKEWSHFITQYNSTTRLLGLSEEENLCRLRKCLTGNAKKAVEGLLMTNGSTQKILQILQSRFGRPEDIVRSFVTDAKNYPYVKNNDFSAIINFSDMLETLVTTLETLNMENYLSCPELLGTLIQKLPYGMQISWAKHVSRQNYGNSLRCFQEWMNLEAEAVQGLLHLRPGGSNQKYHHTLVTESRTERETRCEYCKKQHFISRCSDFKKLNADDKWKFVKERNMCFSCLSTTHRILKCRRKSKCGVDNCEKLHHWILHDDKKTRRDENNQDDINDEQTRGTKNNENQTVAIMKSYENNIFLRIAPVTLRNGNKKIDTYALFDEASTVTLIDEDVSKKLNLEGEEVNLGLKWTDKDSKKQVNCQKTSFEISGDNGIFYRMTNVYTLRDMDLPIQSINSKKFKDTWKHLREVDFKSYHNAKPKILIGQDHWDLITTRKIIEGPKNAPALSFTKLGWILHGNVNLLRHTAHNSVLHISLCQPEDTDDLHDLVNSFFTIEALGAKIQEEKSISQEEKKAMEIIKATTKRIGDRWETGLLWRDDTTDFPDSKPTAYKRLEYMERKMLKNKNFENSYEQKIQDYLNKGYARKVTEVEISQFKERVWYLPHFGVINPNKPGKLRFVFDAAAKVDGKCINDFLLKGQDLFNSLLGILMKFRQKRIAFSADIREMFHQVHIREEDQAAQRFLWREKKNEPPSTYAMVAMIFGAVSSPFSAQYVKNLNALEFKDKYPEATDAIVKKHYMDDYLDSTTSETEAVKLIAEVIKIHQKGGFEICSWTSNSKVVLDSIPENLRSSSTPKNENVMPTERVLGLRWNTSTDELHFNLNFHKIDKEILTTKTPTKREVLKTVMSIYDPLGLLGNFIIRGKIILQDIWRSGIDWDQKIDNQTEKKWRKWLENLDQIEKLRIPRCYCPVDNYSAQLHMFSDASGKAFGSIGYFRFEYDNEVKISLVLSKTQVAPLKPLSIPRLELQAALMSCRLAETIKREHTIKIQSTHFWIDSQIVLAWIKSEARTLGTFIANRVGEIQEKSSIKNWHWVSTKLNVADDATRDEEALKINLNEKWYKGPEFLYLQNRDWDKLNLSPKCEINYENEEKQELVLVNQKVSLYYLPDMTKFSFWTKLVRSTALIYIFIDFRIKKNRQDTKITRRDIENAENLWFGKIQKDSFQKEIIELENRNTVNPQSSLYQLTPILINGLICVNGRINKAVQLPEETKKPIILSNKHFATKLLILMYHRRTGHGGVGITLNEIRQKFWILHARKTIKNVIRCCALCAIKKATPIIPQMGQIPQFRLEKPMTLRPFTYTGIDMFGPYNVSIGRRKEKRYGMLFTCLSVRAVHIELTETLNTDSTILALRRFISRRAQPKLILCDNGGNFHSAEKELKATLKEIDYNKIERHLLAEEIEWRFIPPASPHIGGAWERMVRSVKSTLRIILKQQAPRPEVLETLMCEAEHLVNSRPLTYVSLESEDPESITPNHFLIGSSSIVKPPGLFIDLDWNIRKQWRIAQKLTEHFWSRWIKEYIPTLIKRTKWFKENKNLEVGDLVVLMDEKFPRNNWPLGRVEKVYPGADNKIRVADIKTSTGIYRRPLTKICTVNCLELGED